jgi:hypothetical protein
MNYDNGNNEDKVTIKLLSIFDDNDPRANEYSAAVIAIHVFDDIRRRRVHGVAV